MLEVSTNSMCFDTVASTSRRVKSIFLSSSVLNIPFFQMAKSDMTQVVALAVISRLHDWCVQLFWITVFCVLGVCGDEESRTSIYQLHEKQQQQESLTRKRTSIAEIEKKVCIDFPFAHVIDCRLCRFPGKGGRRGGGIDPMASLLLRICFVL
ncbi:unnamed protein product [Haemonchus placei]|uniref:Secreted protein n=1 Tax=Haemonchus placei TaxID=6290 RepID=A0A0N4WHW7_HAEPC|nr:unnamed protein product [Haemonchus placei]